jgi:hypothetical protein
MQSKVCFAISACIAGVSWICRNLYQTRKFTFASGAPRFGLMESSTTANPSWESAQRCIRPVGSRGCPSPGRQFSCLPWHTLRQFCMGDFIFLFIAIAILWMAISVSNLLRAFHAFREDYRRVHNLDSK